MSDRIKSVEIGFGTFLRKDDAQALIMKIVSMGIDIVSVDYSVATVEDYILKNRGDKNHFEGSIPKQVKY